MFKFLWLRMLVATGLLYSLRYLQENVSMQFYTLCDWKVLLGKSRGVWEHRRPFREG
jgi:hypothetical protein